MRDPLQDTFRGRIRRTFRRFPDMDNRSLGWDELLDDILIRLPLTAPVGALFVWFSGDASYVPLIVLILLSGPFAEAHLSGVWHRWWALGAASLVGWVAGFAVSSIFDWAIPWQWALFLGMNAAVLAAAIAYTSVTRLVLRAPR